MIRAREAIGTAATARAAPGLPRGLFHGLQQLFLFALYALLFLELLRPLPPPFLLFPKALLFDLVGEHLRLHSPSLLLDVGSLHRRVGTPEDVAATTG